METYFSNLSVEEGSKKRLLQDVRRLIQDAETLIKDTGGDLAEQSKADLLEKLRELKVACGKIDEKTVAGMEAVNEMVKRYPYQSAGVAFLGGVILGMLAGRK